MSDIDYEFRGLVAWWVFLGLFFLAVAFCFGGLAGSTTGNRMGRRSLCSDLFGKSARYIEGRCYVASPDGSLVPAKGAK